MSTPAIRAMLLDYLLDSGLTPQSALTLLVAGGRADDHDPAMATDHLAVVAHRLDAGSDFHGCFSTRSIRMDGSVTCTDR